MKKWKINLLALCVPAVLSACSFVSLDPQARDIVVSQNADSLTNSCKLLGKTNATIWSSAETFQSDAKVETQLDTLARNQAAQMGGNTVAPITGISEGKRTYNVYNCPTK